MKKLSALVFMIFFTVTSYASQNGAKILAADDTVESNLCVIAGQQGYKAAAKYAKRVKANNVFSVKCNGESLRHFANSFKVTPIAEVKVTHVKVIPANTNDASKVCVVAVNEGMSAAEKLFGSEVNGITCNGININRFAKKYAEL